MPTPQNDFLSSFVAVVDALSNVEWPIVVLIIFFSLRPAILKVLPRVKKWKILGNEVEVEDLAEVEIQRKNIEEAREVEEVQAEAEEVESVLDNSPSLATAPVEHPLLTRENYQRMLPEIEKLALLKFEKSIQFPIRRNVKIDNLQLDGFGISPTGKPYVFEVKIFPNVIDSRGGVKTSLVMARINIWVSNMLDQLRQFALEFGSKKPLTLMFILVFDTTQSLDRARRKINRLNVHYNKNGSKVLVKFVFYNLNKIEGIEKLEAERLGEEG